MVLICHSPRFSISREILNIREEKGIELKVIRAIVENPTLNEHPIVVNRDKVALNSPLEGLLDTF